MTDRNMAAKIIVTPPRTFPGKARQRLNIGTSETFMRRSQDGVRD